MRSESEHAMQSSAAPLNMNIGISFRSLGTGVCEYSWPIEPNQPAGGFGCVSAQCSEVHEPCDWPRSATRLRSSSPSSAASASITLCTCAADHSSWPTSISSSMSGRPSAPPWSVK